MQFNDNQIATYLYCAKLPNAKKPPLTIIEWNELIYQLKQKNLEPRHLSGMSPSEIIKCVGTSKKMLNVVKKIEDRQQLAMSLIELEELTNQGYKLMFRQNMPKRMKNKLDPKHLPAFFYLVGDTSILTHAALGVVGSRDASEHELTQTAIIGMEAARKGIVVVSGGARGIDQTAVDACLKNDGKAIVFPSEGLQFWIKRKEIRQYIQNNQLLLISAQPINSKFTGSYAMQRNKYIHTTAHMVLVAASKIFSVGKNTHSGTWAGVEENLKDKWTPLFTIGNSEGVQKLLNEGLAVPFDDFQGLLNLKNTKQSAKSDENNQQKEIGDLFPKGEFLKFLEIALNLGLEKETILKEIDVLVQKYFYDKDLSSEKTEKEVIKISLQSTESKITSNLSDIDDKHSKKSEQISLLDFEKK